MDLALENNKNDEFSGGLEQIQKRGNRWRVSTIPSNEGIRVFGQDG